MPFAPTWMDQEIDILSEVRERKTNIWYRLYEVSFKMVQMNLFRVRDVENNLMITSKERWRWRKDNLEDWDWHIHTTYKIDK